MSELAARHPLPPRVPGRARAVLTCVAVLAALVVGIAPAPAAPAWSSTSIIDGANRPPSLQLHEGKPRLVVGHVDGIVYASCDAACGQPAGWSSTVVDTDGHYGVLRLDASGRPRVFYVAADGTLRYATCDLACNEAASWSHATVDTDGEEQWSRRLTLGLDTKGRPRVAYLSFRRSGPPETHHDDLMYAECDSACTDPANWSRVRLIDRNINDGVSFAMDGDTVRLAFSMGAAASMDPSSSTPIWPESALHYASCAAGCLQPGSWRIAEIKDPWNLSYLPSLVLDGEGAHIAYVHTEQPGITPTPGYYVVYLTYVSCPASCEDSANWTEAVTVDRMHHEGGFVDLALAGGRPRAVHAECQFCLSTMEVRRVRYATCDSGCNSAANWTDEQPSFSGDYTTTPVVVTDGERPRIAYVDYAADTSGYTGMLRFAWCDAACGEAATPPTTTTPTSTTTTTSTSTPAASSTTTTTTTTTTSTPSASSTTTTTTVAPGPTTTTVAARQHAPTTTTTTAAPPRATSRQRAGHWLVGTDGGVFTAGDAPFLGSTGATRLNQPIVGLAATPTNKGYWFVARDGGIFAFGDAPFLGSTGAIRLNQPIAGMAARPQGDGYWFVAADGGVFTFGAARYRGSAASRTTAPAIGMSATPTGDGYTLAAADGTTYAFGDATAFPRPASTPAHPIVGIAAIR